ncbi:MAG: hypothetical protein WCG47_22455 [Dermatophilaceae bacterium]
MPTRNLAYWTTLTLCDVRPGLSQVRELLAHPRQERLPRPNVSTTPVQGATAYVLVRRPG